MIVVGSFFDFVQETDTAMYFNNLLHCWTYRLLYILIIHIYILYNNTSNNNNNNRPVHILSAMRSQLLVVHQLIRIVNFMNF